MPKLKRPSRLYRARRLTLFCTAAVVPLLSGTSLFGQAAGGSLGGVVTDPSGAQIPGAIISLQNVDTGVQQTTVTNATGFYVFPSLLPGTYKETVHATGYADRSTTTFNVTTGVQQTIPVSLELGTVTETLDVSATSQLLNTTTSDLGTTISAEKVQNLPLNERNFFPLIGLQPGVNASAGANAQNGRGGFEVNGAPGLSNNILIDGVDGTFGETNGIGSGAGSITNTLSIDTIAEFRLLSSVPSAEFGRASGGVLTIATKSGANAFHGGVFEYFRNDVLDANTWTNKHANPIVAKPELRYNDFGIDLGGPIRKDKAFFFGNYEGDRTVVGNTVSGLTASPALIASVANPAIKQELSLMPAPTTTTTNPLVGMFVGNRVTISNENLFMGRGDVYLGKHHGIARYNYNTQLQQIEQFRANDSQNYPISFHNALISDVWTISSNKVNETRVGLDRNIVNRNLSTYTTDPTQSWIIITGFFSSDSTQSQLDFQTTTYSFVDNFTLVKGRHTLTFGTDDRYDPSRRTQFTNPRNTYASLADLQNDKASSIAVSFGGPKHLISTDYAAYVQDNFRVAPRLTFNVGLRYDYFTPFTGAFNVTGSAFSGPLSSDRNHAFFTENRFNFAPRLGFVMDAYGNQKLIVRGAIGLMFVPPQSFFQYSSAFVDPRLPFDASFTPSQAPPGFAIAYPISKATIANLQANPNQIPAGLSFGEFITQYNHPDEYSENRNFNVQYQITPGLYTQIAYVGLNDLHEVASSLPNQFNPGTCATTACATGVRPFPSLGAVTYNVFNGVTLYNGLQGTLSYRKPGIVQADIYYTYASQTQTWASAGTNGNGQSTLQDPNNGKTSKGPSQGFIRNRAVGVFLVNAPTPRFAAGSFLGSESLGGWSVQGIITMTSGQALNVLANRDLVRNGYTAGTRPDLVQGASPYLFGTRTSENNATWLNPAAFDAVTPYNALRYGNLGFDAVRGPNAVNVDASLIKHIVLLREQHLDLRFEFFNILNHANLNNPNTTVGNPNFGIVTTRSDSRKIQLAARYTF